jgi:type IX secretion system PorP/SprF family membrane protein
MKIKALSIILLSFLVALELNAQDAHFSQFHNGSIFYNPASTGMIKDNYRVIAQSRSQWGNISGKYLTSLLSFDMPYNDRIGLGGYLISDDASRALNVFKFVLSGAYQITTPNEKHFLSGGVQLGFVSMSLNQDELVFDNQWVIDNFDKDVPNGEVLDRRTVFAPEANLGIFYKFLNNGKMFRPYVSFSIFHATMPKINFTGDKPRRWPMRFQSILGTDLQVNNQLLINVESLWMMQENVMEITPGFRGAYKINDKVDLYLGSYFRMNDALIAIIGTKYQNLSFMLSYDYNISDLAYYTNGKGAIELSIIFLPKGK